MQVETAQSGAQMAADATLETIPKFPFLVAAYGAFFVIMFIYIVTLHIRSRNMERELEALRGHR
jgi:hypothetical protein